MTGSAGQASDAGGADGGRRPFASGIPSRALGSLLLSGACWLLFWVYGRLHWEVLGRYYGELSEGVRLELLGVMGAVDIGYRLAGLSAFAFAVWAFRREPAAAALPALIAGLVSLLASIGVM